VVPVAGSTCRVLTACLSNKQSEALSYFLLLGGHQLRRVVQRIRHRSSQNWKGRINIDEIEQLNQWTISCGAQG